MLASAEGGVHEEYAKRAPGVSMHRRLFSKETVKMQCVPADQYKHVLLANRSAGVTKNATYS